SPTTSPKASLQPSLACAGAHSDVGMCLGKDRREERSVSVSCTDAGRSKRGSLMARAQGAVGKRGRHEQRANPADRDTAFRKRQRGRRQAQVSNRIAKRGDKATAAGVLGR